MTDIYIDAQLADAYMAIGRRKNAIAEARQDKGLITVSVDAESGIMSGTDLVPEHVILLASKSARIALAAIVLDEIETEGALISQWVDGFIIGLELAKIREAEAAPTEGSFWT